MRITSPNTHPLTVEAESKSSNLITIGTIFRGEIPISRTAIVKSVLIKEDPIKSALVRSASVRLVLSIFAFVR